MADDNTDVVVQDAQPGFEPEPVPDNLADIELNGLQPDDEPTGTDQVETEQVDPTEEEAPQEDAAATEELPEEEAKPTEEQPAPTDMQQKPEELTGAARRLAQKAQRDFVDEERLRVRQYEAEVEQKARSGELDDIEQIKENQRVIQANQYLDTVERNRMSAINDYNRAANEIPFFKQATPQAKVALETAITEFNNAYAVTDPDTGEYIGAQDRNGNNVSLFNYLANEAARFEAVIGDIQQSSQRQAQQAEAKMRAKVVNPSNPGKVTSSGDELEDLLDKIGDMPLN